MPPLKTKTGFLQDQNGAIAIMIALLLPVLIGFIGLSVEYGYTLLVRNQNQRIADISSVAGALAYANTSSETGMKTAALDAAALNGIAAEDVSVSLAASPKDPSSQAVHVEINTKNNMFLTPVLGGAAKVDIFTQAYASVGAQTHACIIALDQKGTGITLTGGVQAGAPNCYVASNEGISTTCGTKITAESASYFAGTLSPCQWSPSIVKGDGTPAPVTKTLTADPYKGNSAVVALNTRLDTNRRASWPSKVSVSTGTDLLFGGVSPAETAAAIKSLGCNYDHAYYNQWYTTTWVVTCASKTLNIGNMKLIGGVNVDFNSSGSPDTVYNISGELKNEYGTSLVMGPGTYNVAKGIFATKLTIGPGTFNVGTLDEFCGGVRYSICAGGTTTFKGPSNFTLISGFWSGAGGILTLGTGNANSFIIGKSSGATAIGLDSGSITYMGDTDSKGVFRVNGNVDGGGGGSCIIFPKAAQHDIVGSVGLSGGAKLGAGVYTIDGYLSVNTGGANCNGSDAVTGTDVTFVLSGKATPNDWECSGRVFCMTGGNKINMTAPTSGTYANLAVIGPQTPSINAGVNVTAGGQAKISGAFYFPNGPIDMGGGGSIGDSSIGCLELIGSSITLGGGALALSECSMPNSGNGKVALVQ